MLCSGYWVVYTTSCCLCVLSSIDSMKLFKCLVVLVSHLCGIQCRAANINLFELIWGSDSFLQLLTVRVSKALLWAWVWHNYAYVCSPAWHNKTRNIWPSEESAECLVQVRPADGRLEAKHRYMPVAVQRESPTVRRTGRTRTRNTSLML